MRTNEQKLIDIMYQVAFTTASHMHNKSNEEIAKWVSKQLSDCGFKTEPRGSSWGVLVDNMKGEQVEQ